MKNLSRANNSFGELQSIIKSLGEQIIEYGKKRELAAKKKTKLWKKIATRKASDLLLITTDGYYFCTADFNGQKVEVRYTDLFSGNDFFEDFLSKNNLRYNPEMIDTIKVPGLDMSKVKFFEYRRVIRGHGEEPYYLTYRFHRHVFGSQLWRFYERLDILIK